MVKKVPYSGWRVFFLLLFLGYFASVTFFDHAHLVDGFTIVHSHPYKKSADGKPMHDHNSNEYLLIHILNHFSGVLTAGLFLAWLFTLPREMDLIEKTGSFRYQLILNRNFLRGPPQALSPAVL